MSREDGRTRDRRVVQREARRARRNKKQRFRRTLLLAVAGVAGAALIIGLFLPSFAGRGRNPNDGTIGENLGQSIPTLPSSPHLSPGTIWAEYNTNPPTSGRHVGQTARYGIHPNPPAKEQVLHNMEHGAMVIWYDTEDAELIKQLEDFAEGLAGFPDCVILTPWSMDSTVALTAWGRLLTLDSFDADLLQRFSDAYRGNVGPEAGVCYQEG